MLLLELMSRLQNSNTSPILKSLHWLKVYERIESKITSLTKFSVPLSLRIYMTLFNLVTVTTHALPPCYCHQTIITLKSLIDPSDMLNLIGLLGTSFLHHSEFLIRIIHSPFSDLQLNMPI